MASQRRVIVLACVAFFLRFTALAAFVPYVFFWLEHNGHDTYARSFLGTLYKAIAFIVPMVWGGIADWSGQHLLACTISTVGNAAAVGLLTLFPRSFVWQAAMLSMASIFDSGSLVDAIIIRCLAHAGCASAAPRSRAFGALSWCAAAPIFGWFGSTYGLRALFMAYTPLALLMVPVVALFPVSAAYKAPQGAQGAAEPPPSDAEPGKQAVATAEAGVELQTGGTELQPPATPEVAEIIARPTPEPPMAHAAVDGACCGMRSGAFTRKLRDALLQPGAPTLLLLFGLVGLHMGIAFTFGFIYFDERFHASGTMLGLTLTMQAILEVPLFQVAAKLVRRIGFHTAMLSCMLAAAIRFAGYVTMPQMVLVLPFEVGHGYSFALYYTTMSLYSETFAAVGLQATMLGVQPSNQRLHRSSARRSAPIAVVFTGMSTSSSQLGNLVATLLWSVVVEESGLRAAFAIASVLFFVAAVPILPAVGRGCVRWLRTRGYRSCLCCGVRSPLLKEVSSSSSSGAGRSDES